MTKNWIPEADDSGYEDILPHIPTHLMYKTEAPDPTSPPVLHTSHPPNSKELVQEMTPTKPKNIQCFCVFHPEAKDHNTPECPKWEELGTGPDQNQPNHFYWEELRRNDCCLGCLMQGHELSECKNRPPQCPSCHVAHNKKLPCRDIEVQDNATRCPREKVLLTGKEETSPTAHPSLPKSKRVTFSLWIKKRCDQMLQKVRTSTNEENTSPEEWGSLIYTYVKDRGMSNGVYTFYELTEGSDTVGQKFHGLQKETLIESLKTLERKRKAEIFAGDEGVKFF